jgi:hypothetical protein
MTKYEPPYARSRRGIRELSVHPVWRGIGCLLLVMVPIFAFAGARLLVQANFRQRWVDLPQELVKSFSIPIVGRVFLADLALMALLVVALFALGTVAYAVFYKLLGPPYRGPLESPPG